MNSNLKTRLIRLLDHTYQPAQGVPLLETGPDAPLRANGNKPKNGNHRGNNKPYQALSAEQILGVKCYPDTDSWPSDDGPQFVYPIFRDATGRDTTERTVAVHWWKPRFDQVLEYTSDFSFLSLVVPKDRNEFEEQLRHVALDDANHRMWQTALTHWAFPPVGNIPFGRSTILWTRADRMIPENKYMQTASDYGQIPEFSEVASVINAALTGIRLTDNCMNFHYAPGHQLNKTAVHNLHWGVVDETKKKKKVRRADVYSIGDRVFGIWAVKVELYQLHRLFRRPFDVLGYVMKENKGSQPPIKVQIGKEVDTFVTLFVRAEEEEPNGLRSIGKELRSICSAVKRLSGMDLVEAFQAFVPGSPPPRNHHGMQRSLLEQEWRPYLEVFGYYNTIAHRTNGGVMMGHALDVAVDQDGNPVQVIGDPNLGPAVFFDYTKVTSLGMINVSGAGKTTYELAVFLQRFGRFAIILNCSPGKDEAAEFFVRNFDQKNPDVHVLHLDFVDGKNTEEEVRKNAHEFAIRQITEAKLTGYFAASPFYVVPTNKSRINHIWIDQYLTDIWEGWKDLSQKGDPVAQTEPGVFAGEKLGILIDNVSAAKQSPAFLITAEDLANNGKNDGISSDHLTHTKDGLPASYIQALAYTMRVWRIGDLYIYRLFDDAGKPITPFINGTLPQYLLEWFARRTDVAVNRSRSMQRRK